MENMSVPELNTSLQVVESIAMKAAIVAQEARNVVRLAMDLSHEATSENGSVLVASPAIANSIAFTAETASINASYVADVARIEANAIRSHLNNAIQNRCIQGW